MRQIKKIALMAVGDDAWMGGIQYIVNILHALDRVAPETGRLNVHLFKSAAQKFSGLENFRDIDIVVEDVQKEFPPFTLGRRIGWLVKRKIRHRINPRIEDYMRAKRFDYVFPSTLSDCNHTLNAGAWIADFQYKHHPEGATADITAQADIVISRIAHKAAKIVFSSAFCEQDCFRFFPAAKGRTFVMPFAVYIDPARLLYTDFAALRTRYGLANPFVMVSNLFAPTKNHRTLFKALGILKKKGIRVDMVCTGSIVSYTKPEYANEILAMLTEEGIRGQVHLLGLIPRADQIALYRMSVAMVQPSVSEGWSTCVEEAKALGKNLVVSDIEVHREQNPDRALFFRPLDAEDLAGRLAEVWNADAAKPFPDITEETRRFEAYRENVVAFGRNFMKIASAG